MRYEFHPEAELELYEAASRYESEVRAWSKVVGSSTTIGTQYHKPRSHCLIGCKFRTPVTDRVRESMADPGLGQVRSLSRFVDGFASENAQARPWGDAAQ